MSLQEVGVQKLRMLYQESTTAQVFFDHMAGRQRNQNETKVDRILSLLNADGEGISRGEIINLFRQLQDAGCGQFLTGRHGWPSRFVWDVESLGAAKVAVGEEQEVQTIVADDTATKEHSDKISHAFNLRPDLQVTFDLPLDLTENEAERLSTFLRSLPMEDYR
jgi:hypothetical protein